MSRSGRADGIAWSTLGEIAAAIKGGKISATALVSGQLDRIERFNRELNAVVQIDATGAQAAAKRADDALSRGEQTGPLHGVPLTIKDSIEVAGMPTACGSPALRDYRPDQHAVAVQRLVDAGAIVVGKTNVPVFASDFQTYNSVYGVTNNPWDLSRTPGGSSGGAAAALAAGMTFAELGSDLAGSLRVPAAWTGVCALKPTHGLVPMRGSLSGMPGRLREPDTWVTGPMARTVGDLELLLPLLAGPAESSEAAWRLELPRPAAEPGKLRLAMWMDDSSSPVDPDVGAVLAAAISGIEAAGIAVEPVELPDPDPVRWFETYLDTLYAEMGAEFDDGMYEVMRSQAHSGENPGTHANLRLPAAATMSHRQWIRTCEQREEMRAAFEDALSPFDALLCPAMPNVAIVHDHRRAQDRSVRLGGRDLPYVWQIFWMSFASLMGSPALVVPAGRTEAGLPVGVQLIGKRYADLKILAAGKVVESATGGFAAPPGPWADQREDE